MRFSKMYVPTLKEAPGDAEVISHKLLVRAGMIRKLTSGIYTFLPLGLRSLNKVAAIVREEMERAGAQEIFMPSVQPGDLWKETGRWEFYGKELLRFQDRNGRDYCLGPTHEEVVTDLLRGEVKSYRQLPINVFQIQTKFRDEIRPRFGLMRGREFLMKDGYSFDADDAGADESYKGMFEAYKRIFSRLGMRFRPVDADSGSIGGSFSHEFMVLADTGEDTIAVCHGCEYSANLEKAVVRCGQPACTAECPAIEEVATPGKHTVEEVAEFLGVPAERLVKTLLYVVDGAPVAVLVRGDRELNEVKLKNALGAQEEPVMASPEQVVAWTGAPVGFAGPVGLKVERILADNELLAANDYVAGANKAETHILHLDLARDAKIETFTDLRMITESDPCPVCGGRIELTKGIEVGHVFKLGTKYSKSMNATFLDENGKEQTMIMGCYGIGVSRVVAACIEQNHDEDGIAFPPPIAPFEAVVLCLDPRKEDILGKAEEIYGMLRSWGMDVLLDDRDERPGVKFKDADLIGMPMQIVVGGKGLKNGIVEVKDRRSGEKSELSIENLERELLEWRKCVWAGWGLANCDETEECR
ncbi:prolyl-tRNA synthetase [Desulfobaculum xiamenense]|uniref:Proline--tRNA ligase n=1 Tax=Desulfobaculum xiamenense TaxID=995050 RepID=A0A846QV05_9BACT|nr:proline--tRNA ligase [Desulfobaculum xiamenense]NJB69385.1 prolyl-tRNA synthetase [Desulfobaculum xiamenense]